MNNAFLYFARVGPPQTAPQVLASKKWPSPGPMPKPYVLLMQPDRDHFILCGYAIDGVFAGDTWHETIEDLHQHAWQRYGVSPSAWDPIPDVVEDEIEWCIRHA